jgi:hypothetical protein
VRRIGLFRALAHGRTRAWGPSPTEFGLGSLLRSQLVGIIAIFIWALVVESLIGGLFTSIRPYLPYTPSTTLAGIKLGGAAFGPAHNVKGDGHGRQRHARLIARV